jgi:hypothetical protein
MFVEEFQPDFPIGCVSDRLFFELLGDSDVPRILLFTNWQVAHAWEETVPKEDVIRASVPDEAGSPTAG